MEPVYDLMTRLLSEYFGVPEEQLTPDATFERLDIDSLAQVELVTLLEDRLKVTLGEPPAGATLGEIAARIERLVAAGTVGAQPQAPADAVASAGPAR
ncbi:acyl carrier protein [Streptomyces triculaminicus]|uniref:Acyl carrier protein n=2 Tax=Streptomyces TaxID=1883 RepID=A0A939FSQ2_9ACTN|nr:MULTISPECIES: phosphopantetheine-binding protein [Streptomyces]MBO0655986.1 acyl carrier protein [Streptomyces triculaminicus]QSY49979.1 acyl carrier protein [Streptomyces griseocarneus]